MLSFAQLEDDCVMSKKIVFTGGHHNSALVLAKLLAEKGHKIIWFGHSFAAKADRNFSQEYQEVTKAKIKFVKK